MRSLIAALAITSSLLVPPGWADETPFLLERKIPLGEVRGRIDHLAVVDRVSRSKVADIELNAHPESFQLDRSTSRIFVNDPANQAIAVVDRAAGKAAASWPTGSGSNFPMALNDKAGHVVVAFRNPAKLGAFSMLDGAPVANVDLCADADDMFVDAKRERVYVSCGLFGCFRHAGKWLSPDKPHCDDFGLTNVALRSRIGRAVHRGARYTDRASGHLGVSSELYEPGVSALAGYGSGAAGLGGQAIFRRVRFSPPRHTLLRRGDALKLATWPMIPRANIFLRHQDRVSGAQSRPLHQPPPRRARAGAHRGH